MKTTKLGQREPVGENPPQPTYQNLQPTWREEAKTVNFINKKNMKKIENLRKKKNKQADVNESAIPEIFKKV